MSELLSDSNFAPACFYSQIIGSIEISSNKLKSKKKCGEYMVSTNPTKYYYKEGDPTKEEIMLAPKNMLEIMLPLIVLTIQLFYFWWSQKEFCEKSFWVKGNLKEHIDSVHVTTTHEQNKPYVWSCHENASGLKIDFY